jgi:threonine synthase
MRYYTLNRQSPPVDFRAATIAGQAPDGGLYFPETIPQFSADFLKNLASLSQADIAYAVMQPYGRRHPGNGTTTHLRRNGRFCLSAGAHHRARGSAGAVSWSYAGV